MYPFFCAGWLASGVARRGGEGGGYGCLGFGGFGKRFLRKMGVVDAVFLLFVVGCEWFGWMGKR